MIGRGTYREVGSVLCFWKMPPLLESASQTHWTATFSVRHGGVSLKSKANCGTLAHGDVVVIMVEDTGDT